MWCCCRPTGPVPDDAIADYLLGNMAGLGFLSNILYLPDQPEPVIFLSCYQQKKFSAHWKNLPAEPKL